MSPPEWQRKDLEVADDHRFEIWVAVLRHHDCPPAVMHMFILGFRVWGLGVRVQGLGFGVWGLGFQV